MMLVMSSVAGGHNLLIFLADSYIGQDDLPATDR
jgi:hypothetical protein